MPKNKHANERTISVNDLHQSIRQGFVQIPPTGENLEKQHIEAIFSGDLRALHDFARLTYQSGNLEAK